MKKAKTKLKDCVGKIPYKSAVQGYVHSQMDVGKPLLGVFIFVAIPLPMTGVWTGTAISVFLNLKFKHAVLPIVLGNFIAGLLISLLCVICLAFWSIEVLDYILYGLFVLVIIFLIITIIKVATNKSSK